MKVPEDKRKIIPIPVPDSPENFQICLCVNCPTYNECTRKDDQRLFCSRGRTQCQITRNGCICGECPVATNYRLAGYYFCDSEFGVEE